MSCIIDKFYKRNIDYKVSDLAHYCGVTPQNIYKILNNKSSPNVFLALKICMYLNKVCNSQRSIEDLWIFEQIEIAFQDSS